jgi:hypothetical protein
MIGIDPGISIMAKSTIKAASISLKFRCINTYIFKIGLSPTAPVNGLTPTPLPRERG